MSQKPCCGPRHRRSPQWCPAPPTPTPVVFLRNRMCSVTEHMHSASPARPTRPPVFDTVKHNRTRHQALRAERRLRAPARARPDTPSRAYGVKALWFWHQDLMVLRPCGFKALWFEALRVFEPEAVLRAASPSLAPMVPPTLFRVSRILRVWVQAYMHAGNTLEMRQYNRQLSFPFPSY